MSYTIKSVGQVQYVDFDSLSHVRHGFSLRTGGVSQDHCESLNFTLNTGDTEENVKKNYEIFAEALGVESSSLCLSKQIHETVIERVDSSLAGNGLYTPQVFVSCDGLVTNDPHVSLVTFYADCCPIMVATPDGKAVGAAHGGWRGTAGRIAGLLVNKMETEFGCNPKDLKASVGPCIGKCCFETHCDVPDSMREQLGDMVDKFVEPIENGKFMVDLAGINRAILIEAGVKPENISVCDECTCCNPDKFYSHRRNGLRRGSMVAVITPK
ncbi:MAG: peptidoglycan editing factor PgeF [Clostridia bacterium]|nr:peptidoglycan editing factor PgeF [Clostridia bacterium]